MTGDASEDAKRKLAESTQQALNARTGLRPANTDEATFRLDVHVDSSLVAPPNAGADDRVGGRRGHVEIGVVVRIGGRDRDGARHSRHDGGLAGRWRA